MANPIVTNVWSNGEVLTHTDLNQNFTDLLAVYSGQNIEKDHIVDNYTEFSMILTPGATLNNSTLTMEITTDVAFIPTKLTLQVATHAGLGVLTLDVKDDGTSILDSPPLTTVGGSALSVDTSALSDTEIAAGSDLTFILTETATAAVSNYTVCLWGKTKLRQ